MAPDREEMETPCAGYRYGPPWVFKGRQGRTLALLSLPFATIVSVQEA
jgi:hypothetical protein